MKNVLEVMPDPDRRITLSDQRDAMGIPKPETHYSIDGYTRRGHVPSQQDFARIAEFLGGTNLRPGKEGDFANNQHICGTLSMGNDPKVSVCDQWARAHDHENLYLASTGVLPTCGTCNSTENGVADGSPHPRGSGCTRPGHGHGMNTVALQTLRLYLGILLALAVLTGDLAVATPIDSIISTNITTSKSVVICNYLLRQLSNALRRGVRADGANLYPAIPYTAYAKITDADVKALYLYFMLGVAPADTRPMSTCRALPMNFPTATSPPSPTTF